MFLIDAWGENSQNEYGYDHKKVFFGIRPEHIFLKKEHAVRVTKDHNFVEIEVPDFFTPNGDGVNDTWNIEEIQRYPNNQVWIYDTSGNNVFNKINYDNTWQGDNNGVELPSGSYLYMIDLDGDGSIDYEGWMFITR